MSDKDIDTFRDKSGFKLQHSVAGSNNLEALAELIRRGFSFEEEIEGKTPADLAFESNSYEAVLELLKANFKYPRSFNPVTNLTELKDFIKLSIEVNFCIRNDKIESLKQILVENASLRHFYNTDNKSAVHLALELKKFEIYELFLTQNLYLGPHENFNEIIKGVNKSERRKLRDIHTKLSSTVLVEPTATFMKNSHFGPDCPDEAQYRPFVHDAFIYLLQIPTIALILNAVAASKFFKIVFDFKREFVDYLDPSCEPYTYGLCYLSGKIYIAAKGMLDPLKKLEVYGVIAHELCHYSMFLVYQNFGNPYKKKDRDREQEFNRVTNNCSAVRENEEIIDSVFENYEPELHHAELIVRVPQMIVLYHENQLLLEQRRFFFSWLFNFFNICVPEIERAIPKIKARYKTEDEKKIAWQRKLILWISVVALVSISCLGFGAYWLHSHDYSWENLSSGQKLTVKNAIIKYYDVDVKFDDLFHNNSTIYESLTKEVIRGALEGDPEELSKAVNNIYNPHIHLSWTNLPHNLASKLMDSNVTFQDFSIKLSKLLSNESSALPILTSKDIKNILSGQSMQISKKLSYSLKFYVERNFKSINRTIDFETCVDEMPNVRIFLLSSPAGEGKSTTFKQFALRLKAKFPWKWIEFVDLKKHLLAFEIGSKSKFSEYMLLDFLSDKFLKLPQLENEIFKELLEKGDVVFLWDGIDEISPLFKDFMIELTSCIRKYTKTWQFLSTRPQHSADFEKVLEIDSYDLVSLNRLKRREFLLKYLLAEQKTINTDDFCQKYCTSVLSEKELDLSNVNNQTIDVLEAYNKSKVVLTRLEDSNNTINPLLIEMTTKIGTDENVKIENKFNFYTFYDTFINIKIKIVNEKGDIVENDVKRIYESRLNTIKKVHEPFALKLIFGGFLEQNFKNRVVPLKDSVNELLLLINNDILRICTEFSENEITRVGILTINTKDDFDFSHRTFAEFFSAQSILYGNFSDLKLVEAKGKIFIINSMFLVEGFATVSQFVKDYLKLDKKRSIEFRNHYEKNILKSKSLKSVINREKVVKFFTFVDFALFFVSHDKVALNQIFYAEDWFFPWSSEDFNELFNNWRKVEEVLGTKVFQLALKLSNENGFNFIVQFFKNSPSVDTNRIVPFYKNIIGKFEAKDHFYDDDGKWNILMYVMVSSDLNTFKKLWAFTIQSFVLEHRKDLLKMEIPTLEITCLQLSLLVDDPQYFWFVKKIYEDHFEKEEIKEIVLKVTKNELPALVCKAIESDEASFTDQISSFFNGLFSSGNQLLKKFLSTRNKISESIFSKYNGNKNLIKFENLLRTTYETTEQFESDLKNLKEDFSHLFKNPWKVKDFNYFLDNSRKMEQLLGYDSFSQLLMYQNHEKRTLLHFLFLEIEEDIIVESFLDKLKSTLDQSEIVSLLLTEDSEFKNPFMIAIANSDMSIIDFFWKFIKEKTDLKQQIRMLHNDQALRSSISNYDPKVFNYLVKIYKEYFSSSEIQSFILKKKSFGFRPSILDDVITNYGSLGTAKEVALFLEELFKSNETKLKELFEFKDENSKTIFEVVVYRGAKLSVLDELYEKTLDILNNN